MFKRYNKANSQIVAHCLFMVSDKKVKYDNYDRFYNQEEKHILNMIEANVDY